MQKSKSVELDVFYQHQYKQPAAKLKPKEAIKIVVQHNDIYGI